MDMTVSENLNLVVCFQLAGNSNWGFRRAARIKVDGRGALTVQDAETGHSERIALANVRSLSLHSLAGAGKAA